MTPDSRPHATASHSPVEVWPPSEGGQLLVVTGDIGTGKTPWCGDLIAHIQGQEPTSKVAGLLSPGVFAADGSKAAIDLRDLATGTQRRLATRRPSPDPASPTPNWDFEAETLTWGDEVLASVGPCDLLVIDELGPLELLHGRGWQHALPLLERGAYRLACVVVRTRLLNTFRERFPAAKVVTIA